MAILPKRGSNVHFSHILLFDGLKLIKTTILTINELNIDMKNIDYKDRPLIMHFIKTTGNNY